MDLGLGWIMGFSLRGLWVVDHGVGFGFWVGVSVINSFGSFFLRFGLDYGFG